jgi:hypothetical protein
MTLHAAADVYEAIQHVCWTSALRKLLWGEGAPYSPVWVSVGTALVSMQPVAQMRAVREQSHLTKRNIQAFHSMVDSAWEQRNKGVRLTAFSTSTLP